jgi:hypothetical protein
MLLMITAWFPFEKSAEASKAWTSSPTFPIYMKRLGDFNVVNAEEGLKTYHILELESGKADEGIMELRKVLNHFSKIEGYRWRLEILTTVEDTMLMFGLD